MTRAERAQIARIVVAGLLAGGACGAGAGLGLYHPAVGIAGSILVGAAVGLTVSRIRCSRANP